MPNSSCSAVQSRQRRAWIIDSYDIEEEHPGPFPYVLGKVSIDRKYQIFFDLYGKGVDEDPKGVFTINKQTGEIFVQKPLDREKEEMLELSFEAKKSHDLSIDTRLGIEILIRDINDNPPVFERPLYEVTVDEDLPQGSHLHTVVAYDRDKENTRNSTFHYAIKSVSPESSNIKFIIGEKGALSFYGCLDHEVTSKYTLLVEAIDHGEVVQLSSSTTVVIYVEDGNDNLPVIIGQTGSGKVKENESGVSPLRFHVMDKDMSQSKAWRAKYTIYEDKEKNFKIETHTETNDGILTVVKPLDFEDGTTRKLKISVENEAPYFSCIVKKKLSIGLWDVEFTKEQSSGGNIRYNTTITIIEIEDVNDPPNFIVTVKEANLKEDAKIGTWVEKVTAVDRDRTASSDFIYKVGHDPAGWMKIDPHTGDITTIKMVDRESIHVVNNTYTLILHAVDHGQPPMTGTATLKIYLIDVNDNVPQLDMVLVDICLSDGQTPTNISATDPDGTPFGGPFTFELLGDVKGKWKLDPSYGFTAGLVRDASVYAGFYTLSVKVSDLQGQSGIYRLNTTVCSCSVARNCRNRNTGTTTGSGAVGIALALVLLLLCKE
ncbi:cadherin-like protein 26 [Anableps anableps]